MDLSVQHAPYDSVPSRTMYEILRLRVDVFVVEQQCPYPELDGRDVEAGTMHWWAGDRPERVLATCRTVAGDEPGSTVLGRVASVPWVRGSPVASELVGAALESIHGPVTIGAQAPLEGWYARFGFERSGDDYLEDDILHLPMRRPGRAARPSSERSDPATSELGTVGE